MKPGDVVQNTVTAVAPLMRTHETVNTKAILKDNSKTMAISDHTQPCQMHWTDQLAQPHSTAS